MSITDNIKLSFLKRKKNIHKTKPVLKPTTHYYQVLLLTDKYSETLSKEVTGVFPNASFFFCYPRAEKEDHSPDAHFSFHLSDLNLTGKLKNDKLNKMLKLSFDLVIDLCSDTPVSLFLAKSLKQSFMIGKRGSERSDMYNLVLQENLSDSEVINLIQQHITLLSQNESK